MQKTWPRIARTIRGAFIGAAIALACWLLLFVFAIWIDKYVWKFWLLLSAGLFPLICVPIGATATQRQHGKVGLPVQLGIGFVLTVLTAVPLAAMFSLTFWGTVALALSILLGWAFFADRLLSEPVVRWIDWMAGPSQESG